MLDSHIDTLAGLTNLAYQSLSYGAKVWTGKNLNILASQPAPKTASFAGAQLTTTYPVGPGSGPADQ